MRAIQPACHELDANLNYSGLQSWFALLARLDGAGAGTTETFNIDGETWHSKIYFTEGGLLPPEGGETPAGTEIDFETIREPRVKVWRDPEEDPIGQQGFNAHVRPRWQNLQAERDDGTKVDIAVPPGFEGISVRVQGSNIDFERYPDLFRTAIAVHRVARRHTDEIHPTSNISDLAVYVRMLKEQSGPVHARDGPIARMGHLLEGDRRGYRKTVQNDEDASGRDLPGYYHTVTLGPERVREVFPEAAYPFEAKHYYAKHALSVPEDEPLHHPKVEVAYQTSRHDGTVHWDDLDKLRGELEHALQSILASAGIDLSPDQSGGNGGDETRGAFRRDPYFPANVRASPEPTQLDLTTIKTTQHSIVMTELRDGLSPIKEETLRTAVTDGGTISPTKIAEDGDFHINAVYRALRSMDEMLERSYGEIQLKSRWIAELVSDALSDAEKALRRGMDATAKAKHHEGTNDDRAALVAWAAKHEIDLQDAANPGKDAVIEMRQAGKDIQDKARELKEAFRLWKKAGLPEQRFREAKLRDAHGRSARVWQYLDADAAKPK